MTEKVEKKIKKKKTKDPDAPSKSSATGGEKKTKDPDAPSKPSSASEKKHKKKKEPKTEKTPDPTSSPQSTQKDSHGNATIKVLEGASSSDQRSAFKLKYQMFATPLGKGAFSEVRLGTVRDTGEEVAIKIIDKINVSENFLKNLNREIKILKEVSHQNIVCLKDMYDFEDKFLFVMELATGGELFDRIVEKGSYSEDDARKLVKGIVRGVAYLHDQGIVHRDLKPENLLLKTKDNDYEVKIADFGLSSFMNEQTLLKTACGTPAYVAPEVLKNEKGYDEQVDMWSIGVITYILLCGFPPFYAQTVKELLQLVVKGEFRFPSPYWDNISVQGKDFIKKLLTTSGKRMTAKEAMQHAWLKNHGSKVDLQTFRVQMKNYIVTRKNEKKGGTGGGGTHPYPPEIQDKKN